MLNYIKIKIIKYSPVGSVWSDEDEEDIKKPYAKEHPNPKIIVAKDTVKIKISHIQIKTSKKTISEAVILKIQSITKLFGIPKRL